ncbi:hypothetical protein [Egicoccus halophilus]|uniref:Uncharacterized protein n=1 Tax=Egicoccus halophilus TaxID=1670830 RepID=A0A8J3A978_9ACTN|nr:hypothetical protein [Egicoccus halophilus]GGI07231.1 hypothetical protein GCM10011354_23050 [Egicoccus halophilus]
MTAAEFAAAERATQGLPEKVSDPATLARLAALFLAADATGYFVEARRAA